ncbi:MAG: hypothetical protein KA712_05685 [Myxococcales bacterium]|nr:hypothetical protein [Myxococcales bacterium]
MSQNPPLLAGSSLRLCAPAPPDPFLPLGFAHVPLVGAPAEVFTATPDSVSALALETLWEAFGAARLRVVLASAKTGVEAALALAALGQRPEVTRPTPGESALREAVVLAMLRLQRRDVLLIVTSDPQRASTLLTQDERWRVQVGAPGVPRLDP